MGELNCDEFLAEVNSLGFEIRNIQALSNSENRHRAGELAREICALGAALPPSPCAMDFFQSLGYPWSGEVGLALLEDRFLNYEPHDPKDFRLTRFEFGGLIAARINASNCERAIPLVVDREIGHDRWGLVHKLIRYAEKNNAIRAALVELLDDVSLAPGLADELARLGGREVEAAIEARRLG